MIRKLILFVLFLVIATAAGVWYLRKTGISARVPPGRLEDWVARMARALAIPAEAKNQKPPFEATPERIAAARDHFAEHCAACHGRDASGNSVFGGNMYPRASDLRSADTQKLSDGELFYIINNGVRFTGMPAFGGEDSAEEIWELVLFIRRLPQMKPEEIAPPAPAAGEPAASSHTHAPGTPPHKH